MVVRIFDRSQETIDGAVAYFRTTYELLSAILRKLRESQE